MRPYLVSITYDTPAGHRNAWSARVQAETSDQAVRFGRRRCKAERRVAQVQAAHAIAAEAGTGTKIYHLINAAICALAAVGVLAVVARGYGVV